MSALQPPSQPTPSSASAPPSLPTRLAAELGVPALLSSPLDTKLLLLQRFLRLFAYGGSTLVLVLYLRALGISSSQIGLFMSLTLLGDVLISFLLTLFADGLGRRVVLAVGAGAMVGSGVVFACSGNYWVLLGAAVVGVISPSGNEIGPFRAIEESTLAHLTDASVRTDIFAWYTLIGSAGAACGTIVSGFVVHYLQSLDGWDDIRAYRAIFFAYSAFGVMKFILACSLSSKTEFRPAPAAPKPVSDASETSPLLPDGDRTTDAEEENLKPKAKRSFLPTISKSSRIVVAQLVLLLGLDSFASGLVPISWVIYFFHDKFDLDTHKLGSLFFTTGLIASASSLIASSLSKRIGLIQTMVFTHLPSAILLALIPLPSSLSVAMILLVLRACTQTMDVAPRSAFIAAVLEPGERTAIMGLINVVKTLAQSVGPSATGLLVQANMFWVSFVVAGSLKVSYDLGMLAVFKGHQRNKVKKTDEPEAERA